MVVDADALARVKAFLDRTACVEGHFILRFGLTGITIGDLREVVERLEYAEAHVRWPPRTSEGLWGDEER